MENTHAHVIAGASSGLHRAAIGMGAEVIALFQNAGSRLEVMYFWSRSRNEGPERRFVESEPILSKANLSKAVPGTSVTAKAGSPLAMFLSDSISRDSQSFLLFPWDGDSGVRTGVVGFSESQPPVRDVPDAVVENLKFLGWADWSVREIARLRGELRTVSERLAGRKLVERAKSALQAEQSISEEQAYEYLRSLSRKRRITLTELSAEILGGRPGRNPAARIGSVT
ncbi:MAG: ANTAR domain-containing protein [Bryobacteraceae bacterium]|jgi:hypothetical protein